MVNFHSYVNLPEGNISNIHWIGLREMLQENPYIKWQKTMVFPVDFPLNQSIETWFPWMSMDHLPNHS